jgi:hypothetical protein
LIRPVVAARSAAATRIVSPGRGHAGTFERNNTKDDPRTVAWDQANQASDKEVNSIF